MACYVRASKAYPSSVQLTTGAAVMSIGDAATQLAVERHSLDMKRNATAAVFNGGVSPALFHWYGFLDRVWPGSSVRQLVPKLLMNQMVSSPLLSPAFVVWSSSVEALLDGRMSDARGRKEVMLQTFHRLRLDFARIVGTAFCVWLPANAVNFALVPPHLRIAFMSSVACGWGGFLSWMAHRHQVT